MHDPTPRLIAILEQYMRDPGDPVATCTSLSELEIDLLDLPMVVLDIEDVFDIQIRYDEEIEGFTTVGDLVACVTAHLEAKAGRARPRTTAPRTKRPWMSTGAERQR
jgi:acyl carrier protein